MNPANDDQMSDEDRNNRIEQIAINLRNQVIGATGRAGKESAMLLGLPYVNGTAIFTGALIEAIGILVTMAEIQVPNGLDYEKLRKDLAEGLDQDYREITQEMIDQHQATLVSASGTLQ